MPAPEEQQPFRGGSLRRCSAHLAALGESAVESWASGQSRPREGEKWSCTLTVHCATGSAGQLTRFPEFGAKFRIQLLRELSLCLVRGEIQG